MTEIIQVISQIAASALIASLWQGIVLAATIWVCLKLAPRTAAGIRFVVWTVVFVAISLLPVLAILPSRGATSGSQRATHSAINALVLDPRWALAIAALWAAFAAARTAKLAVSAIRLKSLWKRSTPVRSTLEIESHIAQAGLRRARLCTSPDVDQPCVIGFLAPRILVPGWLLEKATAAELEQIVIHEVTHLRRFDDWTNLLQKVAMTAFPLNPALLWIERRLCAERELACDESVVRATKAPRDYAACLTNLAEQGLSRGSAALSLGAWERRSQLAGRIDSILRGGTNLSPLKAQAVMTALMIATVGGAIKLGSSAQLVSFASPTEDRPVAQANPETSSGTSYRNVVFHVPPTSGTQPLQSDFEVAHPNQPAKEPHLRPIRKNVVHHAPSPADGVESFFIVTRWQNASGQQLTVINRVVRISSLSAGQSQSGWFVVPL
jgi:beta-lactamase regulating signal transducer with metallopeptidase domain